MDRLKPQPPIAASRPNLFLEAAPETDPAENMSDQKSRSPGLAKDSSQKDIRTYFQPIPKEDIRIYFRPLTIARAPPEHFAETKISKSKKSKASRADEEMAEAPTALFREWRAPVYTTVSAHPKQHRSPKAPSSGQKNREIFQKNHGATDRKAAKYDEIRSSILLCFNPDAEVVTPPAPMSPRVTDLVDHSLIPKPLKAKSSHEPASAQAHRRITSEDHFDDIEDVQLDRLDLGTQTSDSNPASKQRTESLQRQYIAREYQLSPTGHLLHKRSQFSPSEPAPTSNPNQASGQHPPTHSSASPPPISLEQRALTHRRGATSQTTTRRSKHSKQPAKSTKTPRSATQTHGPALPFPTLTPQRTAPTPRPREKEDRAPPPRFPNPLYAGIDTADGHLAPGGRTRSLEDVSAYLRVSEKGGGGSGVLGGEVEEDGRREVGGGSGGEGKGRGEGERGKGSGKKEKGKEKKQGLFLRLLEGYSRNVEGLSMIQ